MAFRVQGLGFTATTPNDGTLGLFPKKGNLLVGGIGTTTTGLTISPMILDPAGINTNFVTIFNDSGGAFVDPLWMGFLVVPNDTATAVVRATSSVGVNHANVMEIAGMSQDDRRVLSAFERVSGAGPGTTSDSGPGVLSDAALAFLIGVLQTAVTVTAITGGDNDQGGIYQVSTTTTRSAIIYQLVNAIARYDAKATWTTSTTYSAALAILRAAGRPMPRMFMGR